MCNHDLEKMGDKPRPGLRNISLDRICIMRWASTTNVPESMSMTKLEPVFQTQRLYEVYIFESNVLSVAKLVSASQQGLKSI